MLCLYDLSFETLNRTPGKPVLKVSTLLKSEHSEACRKCLFGKDENSTNEQSSWMKCTTKEEAALVQYICLFWDDAHGNKWPIFKGSEFWKGTSRAAMNVCNTTRTGKLNDFYYAAFIAY